jgi:hypothetical protein
MLICLKLLTFIDAPGTNNRHYFRGIFKILDAGIYFINKEFTTAEFDLRINSLKDKCIRINRSYWDFIYHTVEVFNQANVISTPSNEVIGLLLVWELYNFFHQSCKSFKNVGTDLYAMKA